MGMASWCLVTVTPHQERKGCGGLVALSRDCSGDVTMLMFCLRTSALAGGVGGHRGRALRPECLEKLPNARPRNWSSLPNLYYQGPGEATHDSRCETKDMVLFLYFQGSQLLKPSFMLVKHEIVDGSHRSSYLCVPIDAQASVNGPPLSRFNSLLVSSLAQSDIPKEHPTVRPSEEC